MPIGHHVPNRIYNAHHNDKWNFEFHSKRGSEPKSFVGVELEFRDFKSYPSDEDVDKLRSLATKWKAKIEFDEPHNAEICMAPARGRLFDEQVTDFCDQLKKMGAVTGSLSGLHVHIDASNYTYAQLARVMHAYGTFEPLIIRSQPPTRMKSKFCKPNGASALWDKSELSDTKHSFERKAYQVVSHSAYNAHLERYKAVNFAAYYKYKTIEVRMHRGTISAKQIIAWGKFWSAFVGATVRIPVGRKIEPTLESLRSLVGADDMKYIAASIKHYNKNWEEAA